MFRFLCMLSSGGVVTCTARGPLAGWLVSLFFSLFAFFVRQDLKDMLMELDRVLALHYSDDMAVIRRCCYSDNGVPPTVRSEE